MISDCEEISFNKFHLHHYYSDKFFAKEKDSISPKDGYENKSRGHT